MIEPMSRVFQFVETDGGINGGTDGDDCGQCRQRSTEFASCFENQIAAHGIADQVQPLQAVLSGQLVKRIAR